MSFDLRDITDLAGCRDVVDVQVEVWGRDSEMVPASLLRASVKRGGILIGAFDGERVVGFVWSMPGWRDGQATHWSHMLGVRPEAREHGLGEALKRAQRDRALAQPGLDLIEWTFDPLQAANASLNLARLGCVVSEYRENAYGEMPGPLHRGTPTDRLVAEWWIRRPHVERRLVRRDAEGPSLLPQPRAVDLSQVPAALETSTNGEWQACGRVRVDLDAPRVFLPVPARFSEMQLQAREQAMAWRLGCREAFSAYFARGYRAVDFFLNRATGGGEYLLARQDA